MLEAEWLASESPQEMLRHFRREWEKGGEYYALSDRKLRLFACAAWRTVRFGLAAGQANDDLPIIEAAEAWADGRAPRPEPERIRFVGTHRALEGSAGRAAAWFASPDHEADRPLRAALLREVVGNPFRRYAWTAIHDCSPSGHELQFLDERWRTPDVLSIARGAYEERDFGRLVILADALEEAGCQADEECQRCEGSGRVWISGTPYDSGWESCAWCVGGRVPHPLPTHLRSPVPHVRGCWVVDLILGKE